METVLNCQSLGQGERVIVLLHGLFGLGSNLGGIARALANDARVLVPDLRNHGRSFHAAGMSYAEMAADVARLLDSLQVERVALLGHSMGGKTAMQFALDHPARCTRLLVADIAPVRYAGHHAQVFRALRTVAAHPEAARQATQALLQGEGLAAEVVALLLMHRARGSEGQWILRLGLDEIEAGYGDILDAPHGAAFEGPVLFVKGGESSYVLPEHQAATLALFPRARVTSIAGAGHWLHAEKPQLFQRIAREFLLEELPEAQQ